MPAPDSALTDDLSLLEQAVRRAGALARDKIGQPFKTWDKGEGQPVTEIDIAVNDDLALSLRGARPDYAWLSEESPDDAARLTARNLFVIDPIDGTTALIRRKPEFAVCAGIVRGGVPVAGAVYNPLTDECFTAASGLGAALNGRPVQVGPASGIEGCRMLAGAAQFEHVFWRTPPQTPWPQMTLTKVAAIAWRMVLVAGGRFDAVLALSAKSEWDLAAAEIIVREAGGMVSDHHGHALRYNSPGALLPSLVCAGPALHAALLEKVRPVVLPAPKPKGLP